MDYGLAAIIILFTTNVITVFCLWAYRKVFYLYRKKEQSYVNVLQKSYYTFYILKDLIQEIGFPEGCTIVFNNSDWNFSFDENNHLIAKNSLGPELSIKMHGDTKYFKENSQKIFEKHNRSKH
ncbi:MULTISPECIES: hypothetical protein [unclassified Bartonella]|uniref:hypothetical protein n=1 Tax=Bartonella TaxID=773 RepID=UPI0035D0C0A6